ncbi:MAG: FtsW/RodA/SpoVE family cell cycle protein, partial [Oscillospiraceae bacterium]
PFIGETYGGTDIKRGLKIGPLPQFQPTEIMKFAIIVLFAFMISANYKRMKEFKYGMLPFAVILLPVLFFIYLEPHYSCMILIAMIAAVMMFVGGTKITHFLITGLVAATGLAGALYIKMSKGGGGSTFTNRIQAWIDPFNSPIDTWQTKQSLIAIGSGGIFGLGLGNSRQKYLYLPESHNDFVFPIVCEELGFIGAMLVIFLFIAFIFRGFYIASKAPDKFGMMLAVGITFQIGLQAILNIAVATNAVPNTGISLPFFSYGGTALLMQLAEMGVILNISRQSISEGKG